MKNTHIPSRSISEIQFYINHYKQNIAWSIRLYINYIKENKFSYQLTYWKDQLIAALKIRSELFKKINQLKNTFSPVQLELF